MANRLYGARDIANLFGSSWYYGSAGSSDAHRRQEKQAEQANAILAANAAAFNASHPDAEPITAATIDAADIRRAIVCRTVESEDIADRDLEDLRYNLTNGSQDFATVEILDALLMLYRCIGLRTRARLDNLRAIREQEKRKAS